MCQSTHLKRTAALMVGQKVECEGKSANLHTCSQAAFRKDDGTRFPQQQVLRESLTTGLRIMIMSVMSLVFRLFEEELVWLHFQHLS